MKIRNLAIFLSVFLALSIVLTMQPSSVLAEGIDISGVPPGINAYLTPEQLQITDTVGAGIPTLNSSTGESLLKVTSSNAQKLLDNTKADEKSGKSVLVQIKAGKLNGVKRAAINLENELLRRLSTETNARLKLDTGLAALELSNAALDEVYSAAKGKDIRVNAEQLTNDHLPDSLKDIVGDRPVFHISITVDDIKISDFGGAAIRISIPYTLKAGEDANAIVVYYIDENGSAVQVTGRYDELTQSAEFAAAYLSNCAVGYRYIEFNDIKLCQNKDDIEFAAAREMLGGIGNGKFGPDRVLTRGMLITVLVKLANFEPARPAAFDDVVPEKYYSQYIGWAAANGLVTGVGNNKFKPDRGATREELAVILNNFMEYMAVNYKTVDTNVQFSDSADISFWASTAAEKLQALGIMEAEAGNRFDPEGKVTRADFAVILRRLTEAAFRN